jgi:hypothetical protein
MVSLEYLYRMQRYTYLDALAAQIALRKELKMAIPEHLVNRCCGAILSGDAAEAKACIEVIRPYRDAGEEVNPFMFNSLYRTWLQGDTEETPYDELDSPPIIVRRWRRKRPIRR